MRHRQLLFVLVWGLSLCILCYLVLWHLSQATTLLIQAPSGGEQGHTTNICLEQAKLFFDRETLEDAISQNLDFHSRGGNLKSIQLFKDSAIDKTLENLGVQFVPEGKADGTSEVVHHLKEHYKANYDPRGGYGRNLPGKYSPENHKMLMSKRWFDVAEPTDGRRRWDAALGPIGPTCQNLVKYGKGDGAKWICQDSKRLHSEQCNVISIGGNDNWHFETDIADKLGCTTHTFDCTLPNGTPRRKPDRNDIRFYNYCLHEETHIDSHGREYLNYNDILTKVGLNKPPTFFKIDIEGFEYDILSQMIRNAHHLLPQQIQVELHWATRMTGVDWMPS